MKLPLATVVLVLTAASSSIARADERPSPMSFVELTVGAGLQLRDPSDDGGPSRERTTGMSVRAGRFLSTRSPLAVELSLGYVRFQPNEHASDLDAYPSDTPSAQDLRAMIGVRAARRAGRIGGFARIAVGLEKTTIDAPLYIDVIVNDEPYRIGDDGHVSDIGPALEVGAGVVIRLGPFDLGVEAKLGTALHEGDPALATDPFPMHKVGVDAQLSLLGGVRF